MERRIWVYPTRRTWLVTLSLTTLVLAVGPARAPAQAEADLRVFTGTWREAPSKSRAAISKEFTYTFTQDSDGFVTIMRGVVQLRDRVRLDGRDYPTLEIQGRTTSWTQVSDTVYETTIKNGGVLTARGRWTLSGDGKRLSQETTRAEPEAATNVIEYVRTSGVGNSLIGVWEPVSSRTSVPDSFLVTLSDVMTLNVFFPRSGVSYAMQPDGKEYEARSDALPNMTAVVTALASRTLQRTTFRDRTPMLETVWVLSLDGRVLTLTSRTPGSSAEPSVFVYEKQE